MGHGRGFPCHGVPAPGVGTQQSGRGEWWYFGAHGAVPKDGQSRVEGKHKFRGVTVLSWTLPENSWRDRGSGGQTHPGGGRNRDDSVRAVEESSVRPRLLSLSCDVLKKFIFMISLL